MKTAARMHLLILSVFSLLFASFVATSPAMAAVTGTVTGTVRSYQGGSVVGATVSLTSSATGAAQVQTTKTNGSGVYVFAGVLPGSYTLNIAKSGLESLSSPVVVQQDFTSTVDFTMEPRHVGGVTLIIPNQVRRTDPTTAYTISAKTEQETKSQPNNLYQFPGLVFGQPGITPDPSGYVHIRGSDISQVGFDVDGVPITEPMTNTFATNLVTVGLDSANLYTGGVNASYGGYTGGYINEVTKSGRDFALGNKLFGGDVEGTFGPGHGWDYTGTHAEFGGITSSRKFDYYFSTIMFKNNFPGNTQIAKLNSSFDGLLKFDYYADPDNTLTLFYSQGFEGYNYYLVPTAGAANQTLKYIQTPTPAGYASAEYQSSFQQPHDDQGYNFSYFTYKHNFNSSSFLSYRLYRVSSFVTFHLESLEGVWENRHSDQIGNELSYSNVLSDKNTLNAGLIFLPQTTQYHLIEDISAPIGTAAGDQPFYIDRQSQINPTQYTGYLNDSIRPIGQKLTIDLGARYSQDDFNLNASQAGVDSQPGQTPGNYADHYLDPRVGIVISPSRTFSIKATGGTYSEFPDSELIERLAPEQLGIPPTAVTPSQQLAGQLARYYEFNKLGTEHANDYDLGFEKAFNVSRSVAQGAYDLNVTTFQRKQYDLIQLTAANWDPFTLPDGFNSAGHGHASGVETVFTKKAVRPSDWNGFISYTNQVATATSSNFDTGYEPYFFFADAGDPYLNNAQFEQLNNNEYEPSYDQRHTVGVVVDKRVSKLFEFAAFLDAGSGFPFAGAATSNGADLTTLDSQHGESLVPGTNADFGEVPVLLPNGNTLVPINPVVGHSGWHYKITVNTTYYLNKSFALFLNVDNIFDKKTVLTYSTMTQAGQQYYHAPTAEFPQGYQYFGPLTIVTPIFVSFGFKWAF